MAHDDPFGEDLGVWPAFVDLLAATSFIFVVFVGVFIYVTAARARGLETQRDAIFEYLARDTVSGVYRLERDPQFVRIIIPDSATFPTGLYVLEELRPRGREALRRIGEILKKDSIARLYREIRVLGHTDEDPYYGGSYSNWELSAARAAVVARFLDHVVGIDRCKLSAAGFGPYHPASISPGRILSREERKEQDRRIEIEIVPELAQSSGESDWTNRTCEPGRGDLAKGATGGDW